MRLAIVDTTALNSGNRNPPLWTMIFVSLNRGTRLSATLRSMALCFPNLRLLELDVTVHDVQDTFANTIHEFVVTVRDDCFK